LVGIRILRLIPAFNHQGKENRKMTFPAKHLTTYWTVCLALLFTLTIRPAMPQTGMWIEIHVNGPWDYMPDPVSSKRVILIAPAIAHHDGPVFFSGPHADQKINKSPETKITSQGTHSLKMNNLPDSSCPAYTPPAIVTSVFNYPTQLPNETIQTVLDRKVPGKPVDPVPSFAMRMPKPNYTSGVTLSKAAIDTQTIKDGATQSKWYTTWMVLHYCVDASASGVLYDDKPVVLTSDHSQPAVSFVMRSDAQSTSHDLDCDDKSIWSVNTSAVLYDLKGSLYARFPRQSTGGVQGSDWDESQTCKTISESGATHMKAFPSKQTPKTVTTAGSGDCHKPPIVFNNAIQ
jgi:hypothetical protein